MAGPRRAASARLANGTLTTRGIERKVSDRQGGKDASPGFEPLRGLLCVEQKVESSEHDQAHAAGHEREYLLHREVLAEETPQLFVHGLVFARQRRVELSQQVCHLRIPRVDKYANRLIESAKSPHRAHRLEYMASH